MRAGPALEVVDDVEAFLERAGSFLVQREAEHCLTLGICSDLRTHPPTAGQPPYLAVGTVAGEVALTVAWTPPWQVVLSACDDLAVVPLVVGDLAGQPLVGVSGPPDVAAAFVGAWTERTGQPARLVMREFTRELTTVTPPHGVSGALRRAVPSDRDQLIAWLVAFEAEAFGESSPRDPAAMVDRSLGGQGRQFHVWDDGIAVSMCGVGGPTPHGIRIGPVYTPPGLRGRGYASACVAAVSQAQLDAGRRACFLFADQTNTTANHIYETMGYRSVSDVAIYRFDQG
jgi:predicted GNAT family acetyltransferase